MIISARALALAETGHGVGRRDTHGPQFFAHGTLQLSRGDCGADAWRDASRDACGECCAGNRNSPNGGRSGESAPLAGDLPGVGMARGLCSASGSAPALPTHKGSKQSGRVRAAANPGSSGLFQASACGHCKVGAPARIYLMLTISCTTSVPISVPISSAAAASVQTEGTCAAHTRNACTQPRGVRGIDSRGN